MLIALQQFLQQDIDQLIQARSSDQISTQVMEWFKDTVSHVPAYRDFLAQHAIDPKQVNTLADFKCLPLIDKNNYMTHYPLPTLCRGGKLNPYHLVAVSSGSTGAPLFWPRCRVHELAMSQRFEQIFHDSFSAHEKSTLVVVCFALGTWVGGMYSASCCQWLVDKNYPITLITPGNNKNEICRVVKALAPHFEQTVLLGYPPFIKDVLDHGLAAGITWRDYAVKCVFAGEVFSEEWRQLIYDICGTNHYAHGSASLYGTADAGVIGNETPLSIHIRRFLSQNPAVMRELFQESRLPTLVQYDPLQRYIEVQENSLIVSGDNGIPLIRYHIADKGGIVSFQEMLAFLKRHHFDPLEFFSNGTPGVRELPFVYVFGRMDFTVSYFGANIFPENIAVALTPAEINPSVSGKFVLQVKDNPTGIPFLSIAVELRPDIPASNDLNSRITLEIKQQLLRLNSEFAHYTPAEYQTPLLTLHPHGDPEYFPVGIKHRYTRR